MEALEVSEGRLADWQRCQVCLLIQLAKFSLEILSFVAKCACRVPLYVYICTFACVCVCVCVWVYERICVHVVGEFPVIQTPINIPYLALAAFSPLETPITWLRAGASEETSSACFVDSSFLRFLYLFLLLPLSLCLLLLFYCIFFIWFLPVSLFYLPLTSSHSSQPLFSHRLLLDTSSEAVYKLRIWRPFSRENWLKR